MATKNNTASTTRIVKSLDLIKGDIIISASGRSRKVKDVYHASFKDRINGSYQRMHKTYIVLPSPRGRGIVMETVNSNDRLTVKM